MARRPTPSYRVHKPTPAEVDALRVARVGFMTACPFLSHMYISDMTEVFTLDVPTAATDGRKILINPHYFLKLRVAQRVFVLAHEADHHLMRHPQRFTYYSETTGPDGKPFSWELANVSADYTINARLVAHGIGQIHPSWLLHPDVTGDMLWEDVYRMLAKNGGNSGPNQKLGDGKSGNRQQHGTGKTPSGKDVSTAGSKGGSAPADKVGEEQGGMVGDVFSPGVDPVTGREDAPSEMAHKESVARAAAAAKGMGNMPAAYDKMVDELLAPQVNWAEHVRLEMVGRLGNNSETWTKLNRRRLALNPPIGLPGRRGFGCDTIVIGLDTSGSIYCDPDALQVYFSEMGGIITDCRPRRLIIVHCDAAVQQVDEARSLDEVDAVRATGVKGGGGTSFVPVFDWCKENDVRPDMLIYLTDMAGTFPTEEPGYPVLWCSSSQTDTAPIGTVIKVNVGQ